MSQLIPEQPSGHSTPTVARFFRMLKKLPEDYIVWHNLTLKKPHFLVLSPQKSAFLVQVAETTEEVAQSILQPDLLAEGLALVPDAVAEEEVAFFADFGLPEDSSVRRLVVFPNVRESTVVQLTTRRTKALEVSFLGLSQLRSPAFLVSLEALAGEPLLDSELAELRAKVTPETVIPVSRRPTLISRARESSEVPVFLDLEQELLFKQGLTEPPKESEVGMTSRLVTGPAGSGKSLVLLHRAILANRLKPKARVLMLTHNKPISRQLQQRFQELSPQGTMVEWRTFFSWADSRIKISEKVLPDYQVRHRIASLKAQRQRLGGHDADFLTDEINFIRDLGVTSQEEYLGLQRAGRLTPLLKEARCEVWQLLLDYQEELGRDRVTDWHEVALRFAEKAEGGAVAFRPGYDYIFIDEAQFFAKVWFAPILAALKPSGQLFLSADHTQGFLKRRQSWRELGINVVGRAHRLSRVYRSTRQIAEAARHFYLTRQGEQDKQDKLNKQAEESLPDLLQPENLTTLPNGEAVHLFSCVAAGQSSEQAANLVARQLARSPQLRGHILVVAADWQRAYSLKDTLERTLGPDSVRNLQAKRDEPQPEAPICEVSSIHAATGLEATSVILTGLDSLLEREADCTLSEESRQELLASQTRLIYVALTRAIARICLVTTQPERWQKLLGESAEMGSLAKKSSKV